MPKTNDALNRTAPEEPEPMEAEAGAIPADDDEAGEWHMVENYREPGLRGVWHRFCAGTMAVLERVFRGKRVLTPAGKCFLSYCREIVAGTLRPDQQVAAYEEQLAMMTAIFKTEDGRPVKHVPRKVLAETVVCFMSGMESEA